ncbi:MAG TPA: M24 family metallopeptidase [Patescibacteria group bacterium]|nr:M24 family metallopeptidase [Patescibacteria group bacterium]
MSPNQKLEICKQTRKIAASTLLKTLQTVLNSNSPISELEFKNKWLTQLRKEQDIFLDGWYIPPPDGIGVLFGNSDNLGRVNYKSLRAEENWPREDVFLNKQGLAYFYASPVDKISGIIGDFAIIVYFGNDEKIEQHIALCLKITKEIFKFTKPGMKLSDIAKYCSKLYQKNNFVNMVESSTDPKGTNIGHTIPDINLDSGKVSNWDEACKLISKERIFINESENTVIKPGMALTIEPRPQSKVDPSLPMISFHTTALFYEDREKELITNFEEIFKLAGMDYLL